MTPSLVESGVTWGSSETASVSVENKGYTTISDVSVKLAALGGETLPAWAQLMSGADAVNLAMGEKRSASLRFAPPEGTQEKVYHFQLQVRGGGKLLDTSEVYVAVTQSGIGNLMFKVEDIYTGTLDDQGGINQGVSGATVVLQSEVDVTRKFQTRTDGVGVAWFDSLPAGQYRYRVSASNHEAAVGNVWVKPGLTGSQGVFLNSELVTVEWEVTEIEIEDSYEISLVAQYETDVPAAVVVIEPGSIRLPDMKTGDVFKGEFAMTNYGLLPATDIQVTLPSDNGFFRFELGTAMPDSIAAKERGDDPLPGELHQLPPTRRKRAVPAGAGGSFGNCAVGQILLYMRQRACRHHVEKVLLYLVG